MNIGASELFVLLVFVAPFVVVVWGLIDAAIRPDWAWAYAGQNKGLWVSLQAIAILFCFVGLVISIVYLASIRPKVAAAQAGSPSARPAGVGWSPAGPAIAPAGWHPDPSGRHQVRYWDGAAWTAHVSDDGVQSKDPLW